MGALIDGTSSTFVHSMLHTANKPSVNICPYSVLIDRMLSQVRANARYIVYPKICGAAPTL